jgi:ABC-type uncharacterized transport system YnjBCD ATPase subunit
MNDSQKIRQEAREFLDKAGTTTDKAARRLLLERALRLAQKAVLLEEEALAIDAALRSDTISNDDSILAAPDETQRRA